MILYYDGSADQELPDPSDPIDVPFGDPDWTPAHNLRVGDTIPHEGRPKVLKYQRMHLRAVGTGEKSNHARAYRKDDTLGWLHLNDSSVEQVTWATVKEDIAKSGLIFLYTSP